MATYESGLMGRFKGKVGPVIGAKWKGIPYMRSRNNIISRAPSLKQLEHRARFALVSTFVHSIGRLLMQCYPDTAEMTAINNAFAALYANAITGSYPDFELDFSKVLISKGELHNGDALAVTASGNGMVEFTWADNTDGLMAHQDDRSVLLVHCPEKKQSIYTLNGPERRECKASLNAINFKGNPVKTWIAFINRDKNLVSTSVYTGELMM